LGQNITTVVAIVRAQKWLKGTWANKKVYIAHTNIGSWLTSFLGGWPLVLTERFSSLHSHIIDYEIEITSSEYL